MERSPASASSLGYAATTSSKSLASDASSGSVAARAAATRRLRGGDVVSFQSVVETRDTRSAWQRVNWVVAGHYALPRKVIVKSLETLDKRDCPERPGMVQLHTLHQVVERFDMVFMNGYSNDVRRRARAEQVEAVIDHLKRHTQRRRGEAVLQEGVIEWEQTSRIYELFCVDLNIFERIFFTVDVGESTSVLSKFCSFLLMGMIFISIAVWMTSTVPDYGRVVPDGCVVTAREECEPEVKPIFVLIEKICVYIFTVEYLVRLFTVHSVRFSLLNEKFLESVLTDALGRGRFSSRRLSLKLSRSGTLGSQGKEALPEALKIPMTEMDGKLKTVIKYVFGPANMVDLLAIAPFWLEVIQGSKDGGGGMLMVLRVLRLTRVFRIFKLGKYNEVFLVFTRVIKNSMPAFGLMLFFIVIGCCLFGTLVWFCESGYWYAQGHHRLLVLGILDRGGYLRRTASMDPDEFEESPFTSIIHSFWYVIVTITTVGYGDHCPTSFFGKLVGAATILCGIIVLAMPIGVLGANFSQEYYAILEEKRRREQLKEQTDTLEAVEEEQDAALDMHGSFETRTSNASTLEGHATNGVRQRIIAEAEVLDNRWKTVLDEHIHPQLSQQLRQFVCNLLATSSDRISNPSATGSRPPVSISCLNELDRLGVRVHRVLSSSTHVEELADFGLREAYQCRRQWASFSDRCWEYVALSCKVAPLHEPPRLDELKAKTFVPLSPGIHPAQDPMSADIVEPVSPSSLPPGPPVLSWAPSANPVDKASGLPLPNVFGRQAIPVSEPPPLDLTPNSASRRLISASSSFTGDSSAAEVYRRLGGSASPGDVAPPALPGVVESDGAPEVTRAHGCDNTGGGRF